MRGQIPKILTREEVHNLLRVPNVRCPTGLRNRVMMETMYRAGLRVSEVCALHYSEVHLDPDAQWLEVRESKGGNCRNVPCGPLLVEWLRDWAKTSEDFRAEWFFCTLDGGQVSTNYVYQMTKRSAARAGIELRRVSPHVLRHTYATELLNDPNVRFTLRDVQELLGHKNLQTTEIYLHVNDQDLADKMHQRDAMPRVK